MPQIQLNDPNAPGGTTALDPVADQNTIGTTNFPILQRWGDAINAMFSELYELAGQQPIASNLVPFNTVVPFEGNCAMPAQAVTSMLAFTAGTPTSELSVTGVLVCKVLLTADGNSGHIPTFAGTPILGWVNTAGTVNECHFVYTDIGRAAAYQGDSELFPLGAPVTGPAVTSLNLTHGVNPVLAIGIGGSGGLNPAYIPPISSFSVSGADGVQLGNGDAASNMIIVTSSSVQIQLLGTVAQDDVITVSYTPPTTWNRTATGALQDSSGVRLGAITAAAVTAS